jgi:hypothetical protein
MVSTASAFASSLLDQAAALLGQPANEDKLTSLLSSAGLPNALAGLIAHTVVTGGEVDLNQGAPATLGTLVHPFLPSGTQLPAAWTTQLTFSSVTFTANLGTGSLAFAGTISLPVTLGSANVNWSATWNLASQGSGQTRSTTGSLSGSLPLPGVTATGEYDFTQSGQVLRGTLGPASGNSVDLDALCTAFGITGLSLPSELPSIALEGLQWELDFAQAAGDRFEVTGQCVLGSKASLDAFVLLTKPAGWVLTFGCTVEPSFAGLSVLGFSFAGASLALDAAVLLVSTGPVTGFKVPALGNPVNWPFDPFAVNLQGGAMAGAVLNLGTSTGGVAQQLSHINGAPGTLLLEAQLPSPRLTVVLGDKKILNWSMVSLNLSLSAPFDVRVDGQMTLLEEDLIFDVGLTITDGEIEGSLNMTAPHGVQLPVLKGVLLDEIGGMIGIDFLEQEIVAGLAGRITIGDGTAAGSAGSTQALIGPLLPSARGSSTVSAPAPDPFEFALVLGVNDDAVVLPIPDADLVMLRIGEFDLGTLVTAMTDNPPPAALTAIDGLKLKDVLLYCCHTAPGEIMLPDGTKPDPGTRFHGVLDCWEKFQVWAAVEVDATAGFSGSFAMSPINLASVVSLTGSSTVKIPADANFPAGGPSLSLATSGSPFISGSADLKVFNISNTDVELTVGSDRFSFALSNQEGSLLQDQLQCRLDSGLKHFELDASAQLQGTLQLPALMGVNLDPIELGKYGFSATLMVDITEDPTLRLRGSFNFEGDTLQFPDVTLDGSFTSLEQIPGQVSDQIRAKAESIFGGALDDARNLIVEYGDRAIDFVENVGKDVVNTVKSLLGIHSSHKKPSWMKDGTLLWSGQGSVYEMRSRTLRLIPDSQTQAALGGDPVDIGDLLMASLVTDSTMVPSRIDVSLIVQQNSPNRYLVISELGKNGQTPARYQIRDTAAFYQACYAVANLPNEPSLPSESDDLEQLPNNGTLSPCCLIAKDGAPDRAIFFDGIKRHIPDPGTMALLKQQNGGTLPATAYDGIPAAADLPSLTQGMLVRDGDNAKVYCVDQGALRYVDGKAFAAWGFDMNSVVSLPTGWLSLMKTGKDWPEKKQ